MIRVIKQAEFLQSSYYHGFFLEILINNNSSLRETSSDYYALRLWRRSIA